MEKKPWFCFWAIVKSLSLTINNNLIKGFSLFCATLSSSFREEIGIFLSISLFAMYIYARLCPTWYSEPHFYPFSGLLFIGYIYIYIFTILIYIYIYIYWICTFIHIGINFCYDPFPKIKHIMIRSIIWYLFNTVFIYKNIISRNLSVTYIIIYTCWNMCPMNKRH